MCCVVITRLHANYQPSFLMCQYLISEPGITFTVRLSSHLWQPTNSALPRVPHHVSKCAPAEMVASVWRQKWATNITTTASLFTRDAHAPLGTQDGSARATLTHANWTDSLVSRGPLAQTWKLLPILRVINVAHVHPGIQAMVLSVLVSPVCVLYKRWHRIIK